LTVDNTLARRISERLEALDLSIEEVGRRSGVSPSYISRIVRGERVNVGLETIQKIAHGLGTSISYLVGETDDPSPLPRTGVAAHREGTDPGDPLDPEVQLIMERAVRQISRKLEERWKKRMQGDSRSGEAPRNGRH